MPRWSAQTFAPGGIFNLSHWTPLPPIDKEERIFELDLDTTQAITARMLNPVSSFSVRFRMCWPPDLYVRRMQLLNYSDGGDGEEDVSTSSGAS